MAPVKTANSSKPDADGLSGGALRIKRKAQVPAPAADEKNTKKAKLAPSTKKTELPKPTPLRPSDSSDEEEEASIHGLSSDDQDSSDEEDMNTLAAPPLDVSSLPTIAKDDLTVKLRLDKAKRKPAEHRGVVYLGRLPHGFYEDQLKAYFTQFGDVTRVRVSRNKKTGKSKHYAFLEFTSSEVAQIVGETMDNYLLAGHLVQCKVIPKDEVHPNMWIGANRKYRNIPSERITRDAHNKSRSPEAQSKLAKRLKRRQKAQSTKLSNSGITYTYEPNSYNAVSA